MTVEFLKRYRSLRFAFSKLCMWPNPPGAASIVLVGEITELMEPAAMKIKRFHTIIINTFSILIVIAY